MTARTARHVTLRVVLFGVVWAAATVTARAQPATALSTCLEMHATGQALRLDGSLIAARDALIECTADPCPAVVRSECAGWLAEVRLDIPTVRFQANDADGPRTDVRVLVNEQLIADHIDPSGPHELDPGVYTFRFEHATLGSVEVSTVVRNREHGRLVTGELPRPRVIEVERPPPPVAPSPEPFRVPASAWITGSASAVILAVSAALGVHVLVQRDDALGTCAPLCEPDFVQGLRDELIVGDVLLGLGLATLVTAVVLLLLDQPSPRPTRPTHASP